MKYFNKKGSITDLILVVVILFVLSISIILIYKLVHGFQTSYEESSMQKDAITSDLLERGAQGVSFLNYSFVIFLVFMIVYLIISAFYLDTHPAYFVIGLIIFILVVIFSGSISNLYHSLGNDPSTSQDVSHFNLMTAIMEHLPLEIGIIGIILIIVLYAKYRYGG